MQYLLAEYANWNRLTFSTIDAYMSDSANSTPSLAGL
jgi:hypothetical protein